MLMYLFRLFQAYLEEKVNKNRYSFHSSADLELEEEEKKFIKQI